MKKCNPDVQVCPHDNLRERKYKQSRDFLHLTVAGTSRLANNLKFAIAESLDIEVVKKRKLNEENRGRNDRINRSSYNFGMHDSNLQSWDETNANTEREYTNRYQGYNSQRRYGNNDWQQNGFT